MKSRNYSLRLAVGLFVLGWLVGCESPSSTNYLDDRGTPYGVDGYVSFRSRTCKSTSKARVRVGPGVGHLPEIERHLGCAAGLRPAAIADDRVVQNRGQVELQAHVHVS